MTVVFVVACLAHLTWSFYSPGRSLFVRQMNQEFGCFDLEADSHNGSYRWCGVRARQNFQVSDDGGQLVLNLKLEAAPEIATAGTASGSASIQLKVEKQLIWEKLLLPGQVLNEKIVLPDSIRGIVTSSQQLLLEISTAHYFLPNRDLSESLDARVLAYKLFR